MNVRNLSPPTFKTISLANPFTHRGRFDSFLLLPALGEGNPKLMPLRHPVGRLLPGGEGGDDTGLPPPLARAAKVAGRNIRAPTWTGPVTTHCFSSSNGL